MGKGGTGGGEGSCWLGKCSPEPGPEGLEARGRHNLLGELIPFSDGAGEEGLFFVVRCC